MPASQVTVTAVFAGGASFTDVPGRPIMRRQIWAVSNASRPRKRAASIPTASAPARRPLPSCGVPPAALHPSLPRAFTDVPAGSYYYDTLWAVERRYSWGTSALRPSAQMRPGPVQIVTFLWRTRNAPAVGSSNPFADVAASAYYADAVCGPSKMTHQGHEQHAVQPGCKLHPRTDRNVHLQSLRRIKQSAVKP